MGNVILQKMEIFGKPMEARAGQGHYVLEVAEAVEVVEVADQIAL
jgi:hypothetical protein